MAKRMLFVLWALRNKRKDSLYHPIHSFAQLSLGSTLPGFVKSSSIKEVGGIKLKTPQL